MEKLPPSLKELPGPTVVSGRHTVINMPNTLEVSPSVLSAASFSMELVKYLTPSADIHAVLLIQVMTFSWKTREMILVPARRTKAERGL
ncbi:hypothetical protein AU490_06035 [Lonsdalea populi]|uniref:Uncharacterized protein n=2 Tax=Lonsdalea TaxID=1082702 RepID=A0ACD1JDR3_9GAMM|nr:hypothetical protein [Lonsdalea populi]RAT14089.1 hypothetical protein AU485_07050 [Lonsdalea quercina]OSN01486.1 hypothetical protein AU499_06270 [Lonsdalea populi]QPQ22815.1 hypothetical protein I6N93_08840 [Lonsdalea populi]RAT18035.1 hypothetical protein AU486_02685 [Lonsdalea quercina]RAT20693.1 hypothetical protein AU487_07350 [Lonsdalea populi]